MQRGGAERVMSLLAGHWAAQGHSVTLMTLAPPSMEDYPLPESVSRLSLDLIKVAKTPIHAVYANSLRVAALRKGFRKLQPDVVISFVNRTNVLALAAGAGLRIPILVSERVDPWAHRESMMWSMLRAIFYRRAAGIVVQTESVREWAGRFVANQKVRVIPNPVVSISNVEMEIESKVVLGVGRLVPQKGFDLLIRAFTDSGLAGLGWQLKILGDGPSRSDLWALADELGIANSLVMPGMSGEPENSMAEAAFFVLSSRYEGFPNALLEAMALGLPCIAFDCSSGPGEILRHRENGLLIPAENVDSLATALRELANDRSLRDRLGDNARSVGNDYSVDRIATLWDKAIMDVMGQPETQTVD